MDKNHMNINSAKKSNLKLKYIHYYYVGKIKKWYVKKKLNKKKITHECKTNKSWIKINSWK